MSSLWLNSKRANIYSQNGEDGVIKSLMDKVSSSRWCCEFGANDGLLFSNTANLIITHGWNAVLIEQDAELFSQLSRNMNGLGHRVTLMNEYVTPGPSNTLDQVLYRTPIPTEFDLLSIDVDGLDVEIWKTLEAYSPRVVIVEVNSNFVPGDKVTCSEAATIDLAVTVGKMKGYELALHTGNAIFVRRDLKDHFDIDSECWQELFDSTWSRNHGPS